jgi:hypothetical protein
VRRNPFEIRARVQTGRLIRISVKSGVVVIPSRSGHAFKRKRGDRPRRRPVGRNPFEIRARVQTARTKWRHFCNVLRRTSPTFAGMRRITLRSPRQGLSSIHLASLVRTQDTMPRGAWMVRSRAGAAPELPPAGSLTAAARAGLLISRCQTARSEGPESAAGAGERRRWRRTASNAPRPSFSPHPRSRRRCCGIRARG